MHGASEFRAVLFLGCKKKTDLTLRIQRRNTELTEKSRRLGDLKVAATRDFG
jgi:hypothetical protein